MLGQTVIFSTKKKSLRNRVQLMIIKPKIANDIVTKYHYLHRGRVMAQIAYGIFLDDVMTGVIIYAYPTFTERFKGYLPMEWLEFARLYLKDNIPHLASCSVGKSLRRIKRDWEMKYPDKPSVVGVVSYSDTTRHKGTIYKASNFIYDGKTKGHKELCYKKNEGRKSTYEDLRHPKDRWIYWLN